MKTRSLKFRMLRLLFACLIVVGPVAAWLVLGSSTSAQDTPPEHGKQAGLDQSGGSRRRVGWNNTRRSGSTRGLPPTGRWGSGGGGDDFCAFFPIPQTAPYWLPISINMENVFSTQLILGDPELPPTISVINCGLASTATNYTLIRPDGSSVGLRAGEEGGLYYTLPPDSEPGGYILRISSPSASALLNYHLIPDPNPHIYVHDSVTQDRILDPDHSARVDYVNFPPDIPLTVGLYREQAGDLNLSEIGLIDTWEIRTDAEGKYSEVLEAPGNSAANEFYLVTCARENCDGTTNFGKSYTPYVVRQFWLEDSMPLSPEETVESYYDHLSQRNYDVSWAMLSTHFRDKFNRKPDGSHDFPGYSYFWENVRLIDIGSVDTISSTVNTATVMAELSYTLQDGRVIMDDRPRIKLIRDAATARWLFDDKGP